MNVNLEKNKPMVAWIFLTLFCSSLLVAENVARKTGEVKYISKHTYYIDLGTNQGLSVGDTVSVRQRNRTVGLLVVDHVAKLSASCHLILEKKTIKRGDRVEILLPLSKHTASVAGTETIKQESPSSTAPKTRYRRYTRKRNRNGPNRIKGRMGIESLWFDDRSNSNLNYQQLALRSTLTVQKFMGMPLELRLRWRSRAHIRERSLSSSIPKNEWTHNLYELGLVYEDDNSPVEFGFGRILSHRVRGLGYIDGGLLSVKLRGPWRVGFAGGTQPSLRSSGFQTEEQKFGVFLNFERGEYESQRLSSTVAFSGRYHSGAVSREYIYLQNNYWKGSRFSVYQTVELDLNRGWKHRRGASSIQLTNIFVSTSYRPNAVLSLSFSYDARKNILIYETRSIPDSLFDETIRQGLHSTISVSLSRSVRLSGSFGVRFRNGNLKNTTSAAWALSVRHLFNTWATFNARLSYFSTQLTSAYRPNLNFRIPVLYNFSVDLSGGSYIYETGSRTTKSSWLETKGYYRINRRLYANLGYRMFFDQRLRSSRFYVETGVTF
ncbi:MAG: hypothetical protein ACE5HO_19350 [bacterium]